MTKQKSTKKTLLTSVLSLVLCMAMLVGTTFAWFTDSVSSLNNKIVSGNLDVEMYNAMQDDLTDDTKIKNEGLFEEITYWEPGVVAYENLTIANEGTLALRYALNINFDNENTLNGYGLSDKLQVAFVPGGLADGQTRDQVIAAADKAGLNPLESFSEEGKLLPEKHDHIKIDKTDIPVEYVTYAIVIYWEPSADDNNWNVKNGQTTSDGEALHIDLGVNLFATQLVAEDDSFGNDYDTEAQYLIQAGQIANYDAEDVLDGKIENYGTVNITGSEIKNDNTGLQNYGEATLTDVNVTAGTDGYTGIGYALNSGAGANTVLKNLTVNAANGIIGATDGAQVTVDGGTYVLASANTAGKHVVYAVGEGTVVTINGGDFSIPAKLPNGNNQNMKRSYVYTEAGATVIINGGNFAAYSPRTNKGYSAIMGSGTVIITGGTFGFNPEKWVADGYVATKANGVWTVAPMATDNASLEAAIAAGKTTIGLGAGNYTMPTTTGDMTITGSTDTVITINKPKAENVTLKGVTVVGSGYATGIQHSGTVVYKDCVLKGVQCLYADKVVIENCVIELTEKADYIWTYGAKNVEFINCTFNTLGKAILIYNEGANLVTNVTVKNCTFNATASALASGATAAAIEIDSSLATNGHYTLTTENNTVDSDFSGEWRIKKSGTDNTTVNGVVYNAITIDGVKQ